jgi:putative flippase GtrA
MRFCIVGGLGFVINLILLTAFREYLHAPIYISQFFAAEIALFNNFMLHHYWTYRSHNVKKTIPKLIVQFHATSWPALLGSTIMVTVGVKVFHLHDVLALVISSLVALFWNFFWSKYVVWNDVKPIDIEQIVERT